MQPSCISSRLAQISFHEQHNLGETNFEQTTLGNIDLSNKILGNLCLAQTRIEHSNLENTTLNNCDLNKSSLIKANFRKSSLDKVCLNLANLNNAKLSCSKITETSFLGACLHKASFYDAKLDRVDFSFANLSGAHLGRTNLSSSVFQEAIYNCDTVFPVGFSPVDAGMIHESIVFNLEKIAVRFRHIYQRANKYLGKTMGAELMNSTRPQHDWLNKSEINKNSQVVFKGNTIKSLESAEAEYLREWMITFIYSCLKLVSNVEDSRQLFTNLLA